MALNEKGQEVLDQTPVAIPVHIRRPPGEQERIRNLVQTFLSQHAADHGAETFEESDDFDVGDDYDPKSPWELQFDPQSGKEYLPAELAQINADRAAFDKHVKEQKIKNAAARKAQTKTEPPATPEVKQP